MGWGKGILGVLSWFCFLAFVGLKQHEMLPVFRFGFLARGLGR